MCYSKYTIYFSYTQDITDTGTNFSNVVRYRGAPMVLRVPVSESEATFAPNVTNAYVCMTLGVPGIIADHTGEYKSSYILIAGMMLVSLLILLWSYRRVLENRSDT